jgi:Flp pilus assembly protein TadG
MGKSLRRMRNWLLQEDEEPRRAPRFREPEIVVHYWDGSAPEGRQLRDISESGAYIYTSERWYPGTMIRIILQGYQTEVKEDGTVVPKVSTVITARVIRHGPDGVAVEFAFRDKKEETTLRTFLAAIPVQPLRATISETAHQRKGQALIEFSLIVPLVFLLAVNAVNFAGFIFAWITVANAARAGAQYMTLSNASPGSLPNATTAQITALVKLDVASLLNRSSVVVATCTNATTATNVCASFADPEAPAYTLATVDVTYTYMPFIPLFSFPKMGISATLPPTNIHRRAVMRMLQ